MHGFNTVNILVPALNVMANSALKDAGSKGFYDRRALIDIIIIKLKS